MKQTSNCFLLILLMMIIIVNDKSYNAIKSTPVKNAMETTVNNFTLWFH